MNDTNERVDQPLQEVSLLAMGAFMWRNKAIIGLSIAICAVVAGALASVIKPKYRAEVVFSPVDSVGSVSGSLGGSLGGLAALAGISLGGAGKKSEESLEYLRSRQFTREFIERHQLMPVLYARKWDAQRGVWRGEAPTMAQAVNRFDKVVRQITEDHRTGMVTLAIIWRDRVVAAEWANALVAEADAALRHRAIAEYNRSLEFLKEEGRSTSLVEMQTAVDRTMETELKNAMLARTRDEFAFRVLDPAVVRDPKDIDSPNSLLIIVVGCGFGLVAGVLWAAVRQHRSRQRAR
ncbi:MAG TPA: Wzz/FepE/Etk N-terminal domain-containing protein [Steroidobacteraceae bacterium]|nr:Wzz/FepE/Etk N-terminal domain-containing protein [Steroidobacteraceae bacterium]